MSQPLPLITMLPSLWAVGGKVPPGAREEGGKVRSEQQAGGVFSRTGVRAVRAAAWPVKWCVIPWPH